MTISLALVLAIFGLAPSTPTRAAGVVYVMPGGAGTKDGSSWQNAKDLAAALTAAVSGNELWVAAGTYTPTPQVSNGQVADRTIAFKLKSGVAIYGGFAGTETERSQRNWKTNVTVLSGSVDDIPGGAGNSYHVVTGESVNATAILDGLTISDGYADGGSMLRGGGMYNNASSPTLSNIIFSNNGAFGGGALYNSSGSNPTLTDVTFSGNSAPEGGAIYNSSSDPILNHVTFSDNKAQTSPGEGLGGAMYNVLSNPTLTDVTFSGNTASALGGGMYNTDSSPTLTNVTFSGNTVAPSTSPVSAVGGGGMANQFGGGNPQLTNVTFTGNSVVTLGTPSVPFGGGAIYNQDGTQTLTNVTISGNSAYIGGGIYSTAQSKATLTNVLISGNKAATLGGGIYNDNLTSPSYLKLINSTVSGNQAVTSGGGMYNNASTPYIRNSIIWGNTAPTGPAILNTSSVPVITYSLVQGSGGSSAWASTFGTDNGGNLDANPLFVTAVPAAPSTGGNLRLQASSPALDHGNTSLLPQGVTTDVDGKTRVVDLSSVTNGAGGAVDMGAYERQLPDTTITSSPQTSTTNTSATFSFTGSDGAGGGISTIKGFECQLDGGSFAACTSPRTISALSIASHSFKVRAIDKAGNIDDTPASFTWTVIPKELITKTFLPLIEK